ncbi:Fic family protein [Spongisporangium articulatum]|uniref:Fic family protein n=1 Tax=Spongisporangium articulatum TaxID=3362603 RepID=A0ABW8ALR3_9ACTN
MFSATTSAPGAWPAIGYESWPWTPSEHSPGSSRTDARRHRGPYQAAVPPDIAALPLNLPAELLAEAEDAATAIARFDAELGGEIAPFSSVLLRSESAASSQIENLTASARAIAEAEIGLSGRRNATEIVGNSKAMSAAITLAERLDGDAVLAMHRALLEDTHPDMAGKWRTEQVWIGGSSTGPHHAMFVPPHHDRVPAAIEDLVTFADRQDLPLLPQAAITHAQFETIHPFPDGNGRTGRALIHSMLRGKGLTRAVTVPISAGLLVDTATYFAALDAYRDGDVAPIVSRVTEATFRALANGGHLVDDLREARERWSEAVTARANSGIWRVADLLLRQPVVSASTLSTELGIKLSNVYRHLDALVAAGVLTEFTDRRRGRAWRAPEVLTALDAFAERAGRRGGV